MNEKEIYKLIKKNEAAIRENLLRADELIEIIVTIDKFLDKNLKKDSLLYLRYRKLRAYKKPQSLWRDLEGYPIRESQKFIQPWVDIFKEYLGEKTIKKRLDTEDFWIESRIQAEDEHILVGRRDGSSEKAHIVVDGKTGEIRVEESQQAPEAVMSHIETILTLDNGKRVRSTRELIEELPPPKEKEGIKGKPVILKVIKRLFTERLSDFDKIKEVSKIQSRGYWETNIQPLNVEKERISTLSKCEEIIQNSVLNLRGWPYPLFHPSIPILTGQDWIQVAMDYGDRIEVWRMYQTGQFIQLRALREDWMDLEPIMKQSIPPREINKPIMALEYTIYLLTEIFEFLSRLAEQGIYREGVNLNIELINTEKRRLFILSPMISPFFQEYKTGSSKLSYSKILNEKEVINKPKELALEAIQWFIERFGWKTPNMTTIRNIQEELL